MSPSPLNSLPVRTVSLALFFWAYPGSVFEMLVLTECPNELMIWIEVKKGEYEIHAALWLKLLRILPQSTVVLMASYRYFPERSLRALFPPSLKQRLSASMLHVSDFKGERGKFAYFCILEQSRTMPRRLSCADEESAGKARQVIGKWIYLRRRVVFSAKYSLCTVRIDSSGGVQFRVPLKPFIVLVP